MGTPVNPNDPADRCPACFGTNKPFGSVVTPRVVQLRLTSMLPGEFYSEEFEQLLLTTHYLQQFTTPCHYRIEHGGFRFDLIWDTTFTVIQIAHLPTAYGVFDSFTPDPCQLDLSNNLVTAGQTILYSGFANITWDLEGL